MKKSNVVKILIVIFISIFAYVLLLQELISSESLHPDSGINNWHNALWWSITTLTTVGYGDLVPITSVGRAIGFIFLIGSFSIYAVLIGLISSIMNKYRKEKRLGYYGVKWKDHTIIIEWDTFAQNITKQLLSVGKKVVVVTTQKGVIELINENYKKSEVFVIYSELKTHEIFTKVSIENSAAVFLNLTSDAEKLVFMLNLKKKFAELNYIIALDNSDLKTTFLEAGAAHVLNKTEIISKLLASYIFEPDVAEFNEEMISVAEEPYMYDMKQYKVSKSNPYNGVSYEEIFYDIKEKYNAILVGIVQNNGSHKKLLKNPKSPITIVTNDHLLMIISGENEKKVSKIFNVKEGVHIN